MKFKTTLGLGEICLYNMAPESAASSRKDIAPMNSLMVKIVAIGFNMARAGPEYIVENILTTGEVTHFSCSASQLEGDPEYDQETGSYPTDPDYKAAS